MSEGKQIKKCRQSFSVYIPPPARKSENLSQQVINKEELNTRKVVKVRNGEKELVKKKSSCTKVETSDSHISSPIKGNVKKNETNHVKSGCCRELSITLDLSKLSVMCGEDQNLNEKNCHENESDNNVISRVEAPKGNKCSCTFSNVSNTSGNAKDICVSNSTVKTDLHESKCNTPHETDGKPPSSLNEHSNDTANSEDENHIFRNLWVKLCAHDNLEFKTTKAHHTHRGNEVYGSREINENCILEIYDFPAEFKTSDLREIFSSYITRGMKIRWVDDTHALGIYPSEIIAYEVLNTDLPNLKTRNLNEGIPQSRDKAKLLLPPPPPPRPKTCSASARRMVSGALGIKAVFTQAEIEEERHLLQVAREQKLLAGKQRGLKGS